MSQIVFYKGFEILFTELDKLFSKIPQLTKFWEHGRKLEQIKCNSVCLKENVSKILYATFFLAHFTNINSKRPFLRQTSCLNKARKNCRIWFLTTSGISSCDISQGKIISVNWLLCYRFFYIVPGLVWSIAYWL